MQIFTNLSRLYVPLDLFTMEKIKHNMLQKAAVNYNNWYKKAQRKNIEQIARDVKDEEINYYGEDYEEGESLRAICLDVSQKLKQRLKQNGYKAIVIQGTFTVDDPNPEYFPDDFEGDEDEQDNMTYNPLHYWVEVDGIIVDLTATQFNDELIGDVMDPITIGSYEELGRYTPLRKDWR